MIPIWLDVSGKNLLVIGLGAVGQRRALLFQRAGATVIGVDPLPRIQGPEWGELIRNGLELQSVPYDITIFDELARLKIRPVLVLACATAEVNRRIIADCRQLGLLVASATTDTDEPADFQLGALARGDYLQVSVQSGQASPGLSAAVRDEIAESLLPAADRLAEVAKAWRPRILSDVADPVRKKQLLELFADRSILQMEMAQAGSGVEKLQKLLRCVMFLLYLTLC